MQFTINVPDTLTFDTRGGKAQVTLDVTKLNVDLAGRAFVHGLKQKLVDAAASAAMQATIARFGNKPEGMAKDAYLAKLRNAAKDVPESAVDAEATRLMAKVRDTLESGSWGVERTGGDGIDRELVDFVIADPAFAKAAEAHHVPGAWKNVKAPERRAFTHEWLDAKPGRRDAWQGKLDAHKAAVAAIPVAGLDDL